jgi:hypothetical protein
MMIIFHVLDWSKCKNSIGGIMVRVLVSRAIDCVFEPRSGQTKVFFFVDFLNVKDYLLLYYSWMKLNITTQKTRLFLIVYVSMQIWNLEYVL